MLSFFRRNHEEIGQLIALSGFLLSVSGAIYAAASDQLIPFAIGYYCFGLAVVLTVVLVSWQLFGHSRQTLVTNLIMSMIGAFIWWGVLGGIALTWPNRAKRRRS